MAKASPAVAAVPVASPVFLRGGGGSGGGVSGYSARLSASSGGRIVSGPSVGTSAGEYGSLAQLSG